MAYSSPCYLNLIANTVFDSVLQDVPPPLHYKFITFLGYQEHPRIRMHNHIRVSVKFVPSLLCSVSSNSFFSSNQIIKTWWQLCCSGSWRTKQWLWRSSSTSVLKGNAWSFLSGIIESTNNIMEEFKLYLPALANPSLQKDIHTRWGAYHPVGF